jgi:DNA-binding NarL/FixJ family response regulator
VSTIHVLLVDDQAMIRSGIRALLETSDTIEVVGEAADGRRAVTMTRALLPDVVLMDLRMPVLDGVGAITELRADPATAGIAILVLTTFDTDDNVINALKAGANGFLGKSADHEELIATDSVVGHLAAGAAQRPPTHEPATDEDLRKIASLTSREREVVTLVARGLSNDAIAQHLFISPMTAKTHVNRAMSKMHVSDRAQLVVAALRARLLGHG